MICPPRLESGPSIGACAACGARAGDGRQLYDRQSRWSRDQHRDRDSAARMRSVSVACGMSAWLRKRPSCCVAAKPRDVPFASFCAAISHSIFTCCSTRTWPPFDTIRWSDVAPLRTLSVPAAGRSPASRARSIRAFCDAYHRWQSGRFLRCLHKWRSPWPAARTSSLSPPPSSPAPF